MRNNTPSKEITPQWNSEYNPSQCTRNALVLHLFREHWDVLHPFALVLLKRVFLIRAGKDKKQRRQDF